jgi:WD40 repeat protein
LKFIQNGKVLVSAGDDDRILFWSLSAKKPIHEMLANQLTVLSLLHQDKMNLMASGGGDGSIVIWRTGKILFKNIKILI